MIKKLFFSGLLAFIVNNNIMAQTEAQLPKLLPVTPTAAGLIKVGMGDVNKATGAATANMPLYEVRVGSFKLPVSLSYFSQGNKTEEQSTRVGFGWSMVAGGVISRKVMGVADELGARAAAPADLAAETTQNLDYFTFGQNTGTSTSGADTQPDEYNFSFGGNSGKFIIDDAGNPVVISHQNLKIVTFANGGSAGIITITTTDGITYYFGGQAYDRIIKTESPNLKTAFYLYKIVLPTGQYINLNYEKIQTESASGFAETLALAGNCEQAAGQYIVSHSYSSQFTQNEVCRLTDIVTSENTKVTFFYSEPMPDNSGENKLTDLVVTNQNLKEIKRYSFHYINSNGVVNRYPTSPTTFTGGRNGRFYLKEIWDVSEATAETLKYPIDYYGDIAAEYLEDIYGQDSYGFKNGKSNSSLLPSPDAYSPNLTGITWADKSPDWHASVNGMLKKIAYPTKGTETFYYEPNTISAYVDEPDMRAIQKQIYGGDQPTTTYEYLTVLKDQTITLNYTHVALSDHCSEVCQICKFIQCIVRDETTNTQLGNIFFLGTGSTYNGTFQIVAGHQYSFKFSLFPAASCNRGDIMISYDAAPSGPHLVNKEVSGVRVQRIEKADQFGASLNKYFIYASLAEPNKSSGISDPHVGLFSVRRSWVCGQGGACDACESYNYSSNGIFNVQRMENSHIYYPNIIETTDPQMTNGGTEYTFYNPIVAAAAVVKRGSDVPHPADITYPGYEGMVKKELVFDKNLQPKSVTETNYEIVTPIHVPVRTIYITRLYTPYYDVVYPQDPAVILRNNLNSFNVSENQYMPGWVRIHDTKNTMYDNAGHSVESVTNYVYGTVDNVLPARVVTTDSKGNSITSEKKYPTDFAADPVLAAMVTANMIAPAVEESKKQNLTELAKTKVIYQSNGAPGGGFQPAKIQQKQTETAAMEDRILFSGYDNKGNLTEVSKASDSKIAYLWDYNQSLVTAEVKNSVKEDIAYTSFEADSKGNFTYTGSATADATAPTGSKAYDLSGGAITAPAAAGTGKAYIISYWSKAGAKTVTGSSSLTTGRSVNGWTYYEHTVSSLAAGTTISGSGFIDELRLYPAAALMTTFTYEPLVGVTSQCDVNNRISYYEYDGWNRLAFIRDQNKNIAKKICYNYAGQPEDCSGVISYHNVAASQSFVRNNCGSGYTGTSYTYTVAANTYTAATQAAADLLAANDIAANGQAQANINGGCVANQFGNVLVYNSITKNDCGSGYTGSLEQLLVPANTYFANTQNDADALANSYLAANLQSHANAVGTCTPFSCSSSNCTEPANKCINGNCEAGIRRNISSVRTKVNGVFIYRCTYVYCFSDNSYSSNQTEDNASPCTVGINCMN